MSAHRKDSDCTLDPETLVCTDCGVLHGEPCEECGERGYHHPECCAEVLARNTVSEDAPAVRSQLAEAVALLRRIYQDTAPNGEPVDADPVDIARYAVDYLVLPDARAFLAQFEAEKGGAR